MRVKFKQWSRFLLLLMGLSVLTNLNAQTGSPVTLTGTVYDETGETVIGANILVQNTTNGTVTDYDGNFSLTVNRGDILLISYIGYQPQEIVVGDQTHLQITLRENTELLSEVVVIGYGSVKKEDVTGSVSTFNVDDMNKGMVTSPQDILSGKIPGVSVLSQGGQPGSSATIRIRGGSSLSAKNDPLIVIDGVILSNEKVTGLSNGLSMVNPADIETFTVLKDASATAIYGSRASNGVILITTKKGKSGKVRLAYNGNVSVSRRRNKVDVLDGDEYRTLINGMEGMSESMKAALNWYPGVSTDWQDVVFRTAVSTDHNLSAFGSVKDVMPYRISLGYTNENGILKTSNFERFTGSVSLTPSLFDDHLRINLNGKGTIINNRFADKAAVAGAVFFDPTKPVYNENSTYGGYFAWTTDLQPDGSLPGSRAVNPLALLEQVEDKSDVKAFVGNAQFDYKFHFLPELKANVNMGYDYSHSDGGKYISPISQQEYSEDVDKSGSRSHFDYTYKNALFEAYLQYARELPSIESRFDIMGGYSYQRYEQERKDVTWYLSRAEGRFGQDTDVKQDYREDPRKYVLLSFYGRFNYNLKERYLLTFTLRDDGSSRFSEGNRWGLFPALALGWRMTEEGFLRDVEPLSNLKLRLGWGKTGQQDISDNWYPSQKSWSWGQGGAMYPVYDAAGNVTWINVIKPVAANPDLKWEETTTWNVGIDYGFINNRISGTLDLYHRKTDNLLNAEVNVPAGTDFAELVVANIGSLENKGIEFSIDATPVVTRDFTWEVGYNIAYNKSKITALTFNDALASSPGKKYESTGGTGGKTIRIHSVGYAPGSFYVYEQIYDDNGKPIEGAYVDRNGDGVINDDDLYQYKKPDANVLMGFSSKFTYKNWDLGFNGRVSLGNYSYNALEANNGGVNLSSLTENATLKNRTPTALENGFSTRQRLSDYYIQNASFLKIDNITLGYSFDRKVLKGRIFTSVQNPVVITKYSGLDPELENGMANDFYPRPVTFLMGLSLNF